MFFFFHLAPLGQKHTSIVLVVAVVAADPDACPCPEALAVMARSEKLPHCARVEMLLTPLATRAARFSSARVAPKMMKRGFVPTCTFKLREMKKKKRKKGKCKTVSRCWCLG